MPQSVPNPQVLTGIGVRQAYDMIQDALTGDALPGGVNMTGNFRVAATVENAFARGFGNNYLLIASWSAWNNSAGRKDFTLSAKVNDVLVAQRVIPSVIQNEHHFMGLLAGNTPLPDTGGVNIIELTGGGPAVNHITDVNDWWQYTLIPNLNGNHQVGMSADVRDATSVDIPFTLNTNDGAYMALLSTIGYTPAAAGLFDVQWSIDGVDKGNLTTGALSHNRANDTMAGVPIPWNSLTPGLTQGDHVLTIRSVNGRFMGNQTLILLWNPTGRIKSRYSTGIPILASRYPVSSLMDSGVSYGLLTGWSSYSTVVSSFRAIGLEHGNSATSSGTQVAGGVAGINPASVHQALPVLNGFDGGGGDPSNWITSDNAITTYGYSSDVNDRFFEVVFLPSVILP